MEIFHILFCNFMNVIKIKNLTYYYVKWCSIEFCSSKQNFDFIAKRFDIKITKMQKLGRLHSSNWCNAEWNTVISVMQNVFLRVHSSQYIVKSIQQQISSCIFLSILARIAFKVVSRKISFSNIWKPYFYAHIIYGVQGSIYQSMKSEKW